MRLVKGLAKRKLDPLQNNGALRRERLQALREEHGWSQRELSRHCGFGEAQIGKYESGQTDITATFLKIIASVLDVSTDYLLGITDDPRRQIDPDRLSADEHQVLDTLRRESWPGIIRLGAERISK